MMGRHKAWLKALTEVKRKKEAEAEDEAAAAAERKRRFKEKQHKLRCAILGREYVPYSSTTHTAAHTAAHAAADGEENENEAEEDDDALLEDVDDLLEFAEGLDYDKYMGELDVKAGIEQLKTRSELVGPSTSPPSPPPPPPPPPPMLLVRPRSSALQQSTGVADALVWDDGESKDPIPPPKAEWDASTRLDATRPSSSASLLASVPAPLRHKHSKASAAALLSHATAPSAPHSAPQPEQSTQSARSGFDESSLLKHLPSLTRNH